MTALPAGSQATVTNVGTDTDAILDFGIPIGVAGGDGSPGGTPVIDYDKLAAKIPVPEIDYDTLLGKLPPIKVRFEGDSVNPVREVLVPLGGVLDLPAVRVRNLSPVTGQVTDDEVFQLGVPIRLRHGSKRAE